MRRFFLSLFLVTFLSFLSGCFAAWAEYTTDDGEGYQPEYVYLYSNGCWANDLWYAPCLWTPGPYYGYYYFNDGYWWHHSGAVWGYAPGYPPPHSWRYHDPVRHHGYPGLPPRGHRPGFHPRGSYPPPSHGHPGGHGHPSSGHHGSGHRGSPRHR